jgi:integrase/recombinase XerD
VRVAGARLRVIAGQLVPAEVPPDPLAFQAECVQAFVASWTVRGFAATTIGNDAALLEP